MLSYVQNQVSSCAIPSTGDAQERILEFISNIDANLRMLIQYYKSSNGSRYLPMISGK
jgi:hypothetical protein